MCIRDRRKGIPKACTGEENFSQFRNLSMSFYTPEIENQVRAKCFMPNCRVRKWGFLDKIPAGEVGHGPNTTSLWFQLSGQTEVLMPQNCKQTADFSAFRWFAEPK